jgi:NAD(P)-dependent dehydrogenase (short-subunit alcohol dehydrogenase family)
MQSLPATAHNPWHGLRVGLTGGTSGLGLALLQGLHAQGAQVAFVARQAPAVAATARALPGSHGIVGDVSRKDEIHAIALQMTGTLGGLDVLVNNASSLGPVPLALLADTECEDLELALQTNLLGPFRLTRALLGALAASARQRRGGLVLNVSSDAARTPYARWGPMGPARRRWSTWAASGPWSCRAAACRCCASTPATWTRRCMPRPCPTPTPPR